MSAVQPRLIPHWDAVEISRIDRDQREPRPEPADYSCVGRCHSDRHTDPARVAARFGHLMGLTYDTAEREYWRKWADAGMGPA